jgi:hypothetical protein
MRIRYVNSYFFFFLGVTGFLIGATFFLGGRPTFLPYVPLPAGISFSFYHFTLLAQ